MISNLKNKVRYYYYSARKKTISGKDNVLRYLKPSTIDGDVLSAGFEYRRDHNGMPKEDELSVNWLEFFNKSCHENIDLVRGAYITKGFDLRKNGRFAELNIEEITRLVKEGTKELDENVSLVVKHTAKKDDLSHASLYGMPFEEDAELLVSSILADYVNKDKTKLHQAVKA